MADYNLLLMAKIIVWIMLFFIPATEGCSCLPKHEQTMFCDADIVVRAKFLSRVEIVEPSAPETTLQYQIKVIENFKGDSKKNSEFTIVSPGPINSCSFNIVVKDTTEYLIAGKKQGDTLNIDSCSWKNEWSGVSDCVKAKLGVIKGHDLYKDSCNTCKGAKCSHCQVGFCFDQDTACIQDVNSDINSCLISFENLRNNDICKREGTNCNWNSCSLP